MQHRGSPRCLRAAKKGELKSQESQTRSRMRTLHSYFTKTSTKPTCDGPKDGSNQVQDGKQNGLGSDDSSEVALTSTTTSVRANFCASATQLAQSSPLPTSPDVSSLPTSEEGDDIDCVVLASAASDTPPSDPDGAPPQKPRMYWAKPFESLGEYGLGELGGSDERDVGDKSESATLAGAVRDAVAESNEHAPIANIGVPVLPPTDIPACRTSGVTKHPTGTEDEGGGLLKGTPMSEFGCKRKLCTICTTFLRACVGSRQDHQQRRWLVMRWFAAELPVVKQNGIISHALGFHSHLRAGLAKCARATRAY
ncbi:hypothetical protein EDB89DRAFT_2240622 [Lactarius sanguifluus]|nr:hypothetical protein EDB89DRAFT_2240622 [Lactarius sanguifluus]